MFKFLDPCRSLVGASLLVATSIVVLIMEILVGVPIEVLVIFFILMMVTAIRSISTYLALRKVDKRE